MRIIVRRIVQSGAVWLGALIVINIAYVGWGWSTDRSDVPVTKPRLSSVGPSLRLLAEIPPGEIKPLLEPPAPPVAEHSIDAAPVAALEAHPAPAEQRQEQGPQQMVCRTWGPFDTRDEVEQLESDIMAAGGEPRVTQTTLPGRSDYLVYIGEPGKAKNSRRILKDLRAHEIDSALITRGRFNNTLSVGVFSHDERAQRQLRRVAELGYQAGIAEIDHPHDAFHLEARVPAGFEPAVAPTGPCSEIAQAN